MDTLAPFRNHSTFGMHSDVERHLWAGYHVVVFLSSVIGDTLILIASFQKDGIKVNKFIVVLIQHIAVSDLAFATFVVLPGAISLSSASWVLGDAMCFLTVSASYFIFPTGMLLIAVMTTSKVLLLKFPLCSWSTKKAHLVCSAVWTSTLLNLILFIVLMKRETEDVYFDFRVYNCRQWTTAQVWKLVNPVTGFIFLIVPNMVIIGTTAPTMKYLVGARKSAKRVHGSVPWQGALTVVLTAVFYCISTLPISVYYIGNRFVSQDPTTPFLFQFYRMAFYLAMLNVMCNFYIYALTIKSFRRFLLSKVAPIVSVSLTIQNSVNVGSGER